MGGHKREPVDFQAREGRLNRRIAVAGIIATVSVGTLSAVVTAHSAPVIKFFGGSPAVTTTVTPPAPTPSLPTNSSGPTPPTIQLPVGQAFTKGSFTISDSGMQILTATP